MEIVDNNVINIFTEEIDDDLVLLSIKNLDDFHNKAKQYNIELDIEEKIKEVIDKSVDSEELGTFNIKHWVSNRSFGELIDMYESGEIIKPEMQREFVWDSLKCSRLIESIIIGLPIPPLFLLEIDKNKYEIIDGFQRLTTLVNFVNGNPWHGKLKKRNITAKLSKKISKELQGKTFNELSDVHKRIIKRSTIPLIEFKQLEPDNMNSKYLIFERINTGSEKLNSMQIRKSLAYGNFISQMYKLTNANTAFLDFFTSNNIKKDQHVEAFLRIMTMGDVYFKKFKPSQYGIRNILNEYCELKRNESIPEDFISRFDKSISIIPRIFNKRKDAFKRVEKDIDNSYIFPGNINISIMEAFLGVLINNNNFDLDEKRIYDNYCEIMNKTLLNSLKKVEDNPFTTSTGQEDMINKRFDLCMKILDI